MEAKAWSSGSGTYGIRVGIPNRDRYFDRAWKQIDVEINGRFCKFMLTPGFWNKCPEFRDSGSTVIRDWLQQNNLLPWPIGHPPQLQLVPLEGPRFSLVE